MLVAGAVDEAAMQAVVRRLLGEPSVERYRVLALLNGIDPARYLPGSVDPDDSTVRVLQTPRGRSATATASPGEGTLGPAGDEDLLADLDGSLREACESLAALRAERDPSADPGFAPGELRVVVDAIQPLVDAAGLKAVIDWIRSGPIPTLRDPRFRGRSHWLYFGDADEPAVDALMADPGLFDVLLGVRRQGEAVEYRWVLPPDRFPHLETELTTAWLSAEE